MYWIWNFSSYVSTSNWAFHTYLFINSKKSIIFSKFLIRSNLRPFKLWLYLCHTRQPEIGHKNFAPQISIKTFFGVSTYSKVLVTSNLFLNFFQSFNIHPLLLGDTSCRKIFQTEEKVRKSVSWYEKSCERSLDVILTNKWRRRQVY